jgi:hypothetical protein
VTALTAVASRCYGSCPFLTIALDNPITGKYAALDQWPVADGQPEDELILLVGESSRALSRGIINGVLICLCFWIPLAVALAIVLV